MEFNHFGQYSILLGSGLTIVLAAAAWAGGFTPYRSGFVYGALYCLAGVGLQFGVRGYNAAARGLATNRATSVIGMVLCTLFVVAETAWIFVHHL